MSFNDCNYSSIMEATESPGVQDTSGLFRVWIDIVWIASIYFKSVHGAGETGC